ncbi:Hypothetical predicted protein [Octopus vulgaris]|uniref:Uncharacterized protein n=1 Tax=Octopus vulgaris TaxID=6645 RepID=A0AA36FA32_OCTVU|nr:Hypothetical predicted protein [Octopus vulgaris]
MSAMTLMTDCYDDNDINAKTDVNYDSYNINSYDVLHKDDKNRTGNRMKVDDSDVTWDGDDRYGTWYGDDSDDTWDGNDIDDALDSDDIDDTLDSDDNDNA